MTIPLEICIGGDLKANEIRLGCLNGVPDLLDGRLEDGEFEQGEKGGNEVFIALKEAINLGIVLEEAKEFHSYDRVDEEKHADEEKNEASARQDDRESLDDFLCEGDLIEH